LEIVETLTNNVVVPTEIAIELAFLSAVSQTTCSKVTKTMPNHESVPHSRAERYPVAPLVAVDRANTMRW
jgi:hypothetical protein